MATLLILMIRWFIAGVFSCGPALVKLGDQATSGPRSPTMNCCRSGSWCGRDGAPAGRYRRRRPARSWGSSRGAAARSCSAWLLAVFGGAIASTSPAAAPSTAALRIVHAQPISWRHFRSRLGAGRWRCPGGRGSSLVAASFWPDNQANPLDASPVGQHHPRRQSPFSRADRHARGPAGLHPPGPVTAVSAALNQPTTSVI